MGLIREACIYGVERPCGCGGKSYVMQLSSYHPPAEDRVKRSPYESMWLRVCRLCGQAHFLTQEEWDDRKGNPLDERVGLDDFHFDEEAQRWRVDFTKEGCSND